jgi:predicted tellurium resistance membrane protein TerC
VFAVDSILAAVAMSDKLWVVITGALLGIVAIRLVASQVLALVKRYPALIDGAYIIIAWVGVKLVVEYLHAAGLVHFEITKKAPRMRRSSRPSSRQRLRSPRYTC